MNLKALHVLISQIFSGTAESLFSLITGLFTSLESEGVLTFFDIDYSNALGRVMKKA